MFPSVLFENHDSAAHSRGLTAICVASQLVPPASEWRTKIRLSRPPSLPPAYHETSSEPSSSSMSDEPCCTAMAISAETMLVLKTCARAMEAALRTKAKIAQMLVKRRAFIRFKEWLRVMSGEVETSLTASDGRTLRDSSIAVRMRRKVRLSRA